MQVKEVMREQSEMKEIPATEVEEVRRILSEWDYQGETLESMTSNIVSNPKSRYVECQVGFNLAKCFCFFRIFFFVQYIEPGCPMNH
jgi:hypothetical protein